MLIKIYYKDKLDDGRDTYRLIDKLLFDDLGGTIAEVAVALLKMSRGEVWYDLDGGRRPIMEGDRLVYDGYTFEYVENVLLSKDKKKGAGSEIYLSPGILPLKGTRLSLVRIEEDKK